MGSSYDLQKYVFSEKMTRIKVVEVIKDYFLVTLSLTLRVNWRSTLNF